MYLISNLAPLVVADMRVVFMIPLLFLGTMAQDDIQGSLENDEPGNLFSTEVPLDYETSLSTLNPGGIEGKSTTLDPLNTQTNVTFGCPEQCRDRYESCARRKNYCGILMYHKMMTKACPVTCDRCKDDCMDLRRHCIRHRCTRDRYAKEMQHGCQKTCKFCVPFTCSDKPPINNP